MVEHEPAYRPLAGAPARVEGRWNVIAAHGLMMDRRVDPGPSSSILPEELDRIDADYIALGHIHTFQVIRHEPLTAYAGALASSLNGRPGAVLVDLEAHRPPSLRWHDLAATDSGGE